MTAIAYVPAFNPPEQPTSTLGRHLLQPASNARVTVATAIHNLDQRHGAIQQPSVYESQLPPA